MQDIADSLGLSRNTVSKAINNTGILAEKTRKKILQRAAEMGYHRCVYPSAFHSAIASMPSPADPGELALISQNVPYGSHFGTYALNTFQERISQNNYRLAIFPVRAEEIAARQLPLGFNKDKTDGIICMEMFQPEYIDMLLSLDIPLLLVDTAYDTNFSILHTDILMMENRESMYRLTEQLIRSGFRSLAFAGDRHHCRSFRERYEGFMQAISDNHMSPHTGKLADTNVFSSDILINDALEKLDRLPNVFVCANDFTAIALIRVLRRRGVRIPNDVCITGFDNAAESRIIEPQLTTVDIPSSQMGYIAADLLLSRIREPQLPHRLTYVRTSVIERDSSRKL